jgi:hypothetical protein
MKASARLAIVAAVALLALGGLLVPSPADSPLGRVANVDGDGRDPLWDTPVDGAAMRRAGELLPDDARYLLWAPAAPPLLQGNLKAAGQLFLAPALPVQDPAAARWVLSYRASPSLPPDLEAGETSRVGPGILLVRIAP